MKEKPLTNKQNNQVSFFDHHNFFMWVTEIFDPFLDGYTIGSLSCTSRFFSTSLKASRDKKTLWQITPGNEQTLILNRKTGELYGVGGNYNYSLGIYKSPIPDVMKISHREGVKACEIFVAYKQSFIRYEDGKLFAAGRNHSNELGPVSPYYSLAFQEVYIPYNMQVVQVAVMGFRNTLFLTNDNKLYSYKFAHHGTGIVSLPENKIPIYITAGFSHALIFCKDRTVYGLGKPCFYQLGHLNGDRSSKPELIEISKDIKIKKILARGEFSLFLTQDNHLYISGRLVNAIKNFKGFQPLILPKDMNIKYVYAGENHIIIQSTDNKLYGMGSNKLGQLGLGQLGVVLNFTEIIIPTKSQIYYVVTGYDYTFVVCEHNEIYGFGYAASQLGVAAGACDLPRRLNLFDAIQKLNSISVPDLGESTLNSRPTYG